MALLVYSEDLTGHLNEGPLKASNSARLCPRDMHKVAKV